MTRIALVKQVGAHLALRSAASGLFEDDTVRGSDVVVDFAGVRSMGRSFAQEYILCRSRHQYGVTEVNLSDDVRTMFRIVADPKPRPKTPLIKSTETIVIKA